MRMNQDERRFDFHGLGPALKRAREEKGWTQAYVAELVDRDSRTIMNIEFHGAVIHRYTKCRKLLVSLGFRHFSVSRRFAKLGVFL